MNTHLHPVFRGILDAAAAPAPSTEGASMSKTNEAKHTPGAMDNIQTRNWIVEEKRPGAWRVTCEYEEGGTWYTSIVHEGYSETVARLIAAAPDLLAACKEAKREIEILFHAQHCLSSVTNNPTYKAILAAIAKATP